eukprot:CAMPEP_0170368732 /NCGR_PEP_ID=MMETSP0117_2-20130122/7610_1 /TAXON_ID=400756 /ORGANISM="Durinskia baltica, Strain CSIRO CS-38" /LENGTH=79 /DNA_ID=CAMNT_0010623411 /DNA_START=91 /DNA_END=330 /DNA_ORIENTATION=-
MILPVSAMRGASPWVAKFLHPTVRMISRIEAFGCLALREMRESAGWDTTVATNPDMNPAQKVTANWVEVEKSVLSPSRT